MLVSRERKILFVHIQKTGGSSISEALVRGVADMRQWKGKHDFIDKGETAINDWHAYFKFAFVRNPWDRLVSWYAMITRARDIGWYETILDARKRKHYRQARRNALWQYVYENAGSFEEFIRHCSQPVAVEPGVYYSFAYNQLDYITDDDGNVLMDFVGRYENFATDLNAVFERMGIPLRGLPVENRSARGDYRDYYTEETRQIVARRFVRDIEYFGYEFAATS